MTSTEWNHQKAYAWVADYAKELGSDAYQNREEWMYACAGAAYHAIHTGVGFKTRQEFIELLRNHIQLNDDFIREALQEIEG